jgi:alcohol dehydrogenase (NADP+)
MVQALMTTDFAIDPHSVPKHVLYTGARIPAIGFRTMDPASVATLTIADIVLGAASVGYRHFDCASVAGSERHIASSFQQMLLSGIVREELWVTSRVQSGRNGDIDVIASCTRSISELQLDYLDLYLMHRPFPSIRGHGGDVHFCGTGARPHVHQECMKTWQQMEKLVTMGLVRHIGASNMTIVELELLLADAAIKPAVHAMELHPHFQQPELFRYVVEHGIVPIGYCPLGSPNRPDRRRTVGGAMDLEDPVIINIARRHRIPPVEVCLKWALQRGQIPIPVSTKRCNYFNNLKSAVTPPLSSDDMQAIERIDKACPAYQGPRNSDVIDRPYPAERPDLPCEPADSAAREYDPQPPGTP